VAQVLEATGANAADLLTALRNDTLDKALDAIGWWAGMTGVGAPNGIADLRHRATAGLEGFEFRHWIEFDLSVEDAINIVLEGDEAFDSTADDDGNDPHGQRLAAAVSIVCDYLLNLTTKWTARDIKLARIYIDRLAETHEHTYKAYDFESWVESLTELNRALLRGLEAAAV
jgi:hypothetical protein